MPFVPRAKSRNILTKTLPASVPALALAAGLAAIAALTPVPAAAHPQSDEGGYVNSQFMEDRAGEASGRLVIRNTSILPRTVYARFQMPDDPNNRNYGFEQTIPPLSSLAYDLPVGVRVYACDGKYWDSYRPDEAFAVTIAKDETHRFSHSQFKPTAIRRDPSR